MEKDYPSFKRLELSEIDENSSLKQLFYLVGNHKKVIDLGCASGYFAQLLSDIGCVVTGIELNPHAAKLARQFCDNVVVADLDYVDVSTILPEQSFDVAVFGDVLEHLRDPWKVLRDTRHLLKPDGYVVASIPNIAHGAIRLSLLQGRFEYTKFGILDDTHLRFFTKTTIKELFEKAGFFVHKINTVKLPIFCGSSLLPAIDINQFDTALIDEILQDEDSDTLQFIVQAFPLSMDGQLAVKDQQIQELQSRLMEAEQQNEIHLFNVQSLQAQLQDSQSLSQNYQIQIESQDNVIQHLNDQVRELNDQVEELNDQVQGAFAHRDGVQIRLEGALQAQQNLQIELDQANSQIQAMRSSKFWQIRKLWFRAKRFLHLTREQEE